MNLLLDRRNTQIMISWFHPRWMFSKQEPTVRFLSPLLPKSVKFSQECQACTTWPLISSAQTTSRQYKVQRLVGQLRSRSFSASPSNANPSCGHQRGWQYQGGRKRISGARVSEKNLESVKISQISKKETQNLHVSCILVFLTCDSRITGMIWKCSLDYYSFFLHLRFSVFSRSGGIQSASASTANLHLHSVWWVKQLFYSA